MAESHINSDAASPASKKELEILEFWEKEQIFQKTLEKPSPEGDFVFFEGPPTANGRPGIHHVEARSFKDIIPRYKTMRGFRVRRKAGWDTHGLPVELQVEKALDLKSKKEIEAYGITEFNKKCKESVWTYKEEWEQLTNRMGFWLDLSDPYITYKNDYIEALWSVVKRADERGHLYKDFKVVPWCTRCGTTLSSHELNQPGAYKDVKDLSVYVKFKIKSGQKIGNFETDDKTYILAWTTTPWTLSGNVALAVGRDIEYIGLHIKEGSLNFVPGNYIIARDRAHEVFNLDKKHSLESGTWGSMNSTSLDEAEIRYSVLGQGKGSDLVGLEYEPLYPYLSEIAFGDQKEKLQNAFKVYAADFVTTTDGTGIVHMAPMYGADDFDVATKNNLPKVHTVNEEGKFVSGTGFLEGRYVKEHDENGKPTLAVDIIDDLKKRNLFFKQENVKHSYPHCWRCDTPLLYYARTSWYFSMSKLRQQLLDANEKINWEPSHIKEGRFGEWLDGIKDWAISRDRYWGTPLPIWSTEGGTKKMVIGSLEDIKKYTKKSGNNYIVMRHGESESNLQNLCSGDPKNNHPLTEKGRQDVKDSASDLKDKKITKIFASPNMRGQQTAEIVAEIIGLPKESIITDDRLKELDFGEFEGKSFTEFLKYREGNMVAMDTRLPNGESFQDVKNRAGSFLYDIESQYQNEAVLMVSHGVITETLPSVVGGFDAQKSREIVVESQLLKAGFREFNFISLPHNENYELDFHKPFIDQIRLEDEEGNWMSRTPEVMDVWFDSGSMPYAQGHVLGEEMNFKPTPADYISEGIDQTRGWFYTMHAVANMMNDVPTVAYKNVICLGLILDQEGQKMSKSRGNVVNPWDMFDKYGADALRFWMYSINQPGESKNFDEKTVDEVNKKVFNLLRNVVKFYEMYGTNALGESWEAINYRASPYVLDQWIIAKTDELVKNVTRWLDDYKLLESSRAIRDYIADLSQWYIRRSRDRFKSDDVDDRAYALATTRAVLLGIAKIMAPFTPFFAEELYQALRSGKEIVESVHLADWPKAESIDQKVLADMETVRSLVSRVLELRAKAGIKIRQPLASVTLSIKLEKGYEAILADEVNVKEILHDENISEGEVILDTAITPELKREGQYREFLRQIQELRKKSGLEPCDKVILVLETSSEGHDLIDEFKSDLVAAAGIQSIEKGEGFVPSVVDGIEEISADGLNFKVQISKV